MRARVLLVFASLTTVGCGGAAIGPELTLRATASELRLAAAETEPADAPPTHRTNAERRELADALDAARLERRALVTLPGVEGNTRSVVLVEEEGGMRVEAGVLGIPALDTPERAIAALHRALARELSLGSGVLLMETERLAWIEEMTRYRDGTASPRVARRPGRGRSRLDRHAARRSHHPRARGRRVAHRLDAGRRPRVVSRP